MPGLDRGLQGCLFLSWRGVIVALKATAPWPAPGCSTLQMTSRGDIETWSQPAVRLLAEPRAPNPRAPFLARSHRPGQELCWGPAPRSRRAPALLGQRARQELY